MPRLGLGLCGLQYYNGFNPILNWWKTARYPTLVRSSGGNLVGEDIWTTGGYLDTDTGEIVDPAPANLTGIDRIFFAPVNSYAIGVGCDFAGEQWVAEWEGSATAQFFNAGTGSSQSNDGSNKRLLTMGSSPGNVSLQLTLTDVNDPPRNIRVYQARYAANVAAGETFNPDWLAEVSKFRSLRFMDWMVTNFSKIDTIASLATKDWHAWGQNEDAYGAKFGIPLAVIIDVANETGVRPWVTIPHKADDDLVEHFAETLKAGTSLVPIIEYTNEPWNFGFGQFSWLSTAGEAIWPGDGLRHMKYYGYRAAQISKIFRDVYADDTRWEVALGTQTVSTSITDAIDAGIDYWISENSSSLTHAQIAQALGVTGYFGDVRTSKPISGITKANPAVVTASSHGRSNGDDIKIFIQTGMTELNDTYATVANKTTDTLELSGVNSTAFTTYASGNNYLVPAALFRLMDESESLFGSNPTRYPTKYQYFIEQMAQSCLTGNCDFGYATNVSVHSLRDTYWPAQKAKADAKGRRLVQYESGCHFVGDVYLTGYGGVPQLNEYISPLGYSPEIAAVYGAMYQAWVKLVGNDASKFVEAGANTGRFGTWAGIRFWPLAANGDTDDFGNPVWRATLRANAGKRTITLT